MARRMVIKEIETRNFMSHAGYRRIRPPLDKSSFPVVDEDVQAALLFVFGDLAKDKEIISKNGNTAQVSVCFQDMFDSDVPTADEDFVITRIANRDNTSRYFMNGCESNLAQVTKKLKENGVDLNLILSINKQLFGKEVESHMQLKGSTIIAVVCEHKMLVKAEGRTMVGLRDMEDRIVQGYCQKIMAIGTNVLASLSGDVSQAMDMVKALQVIFNGKQGTKGRIKCECKSYLERWRSKRSKRSKEDEVENSDDFILQLYGYEGSVPWIYTANLDTYEDVEVGKMVGHGEGFRCASDFISTHLKRLGKSCVDVDAYDTLLSLSLGIACIFTDLSGGYITSGTVEKNAQVVHKERPHVVEVLFEDFDLVEEYFPRVIMLNTHGIPYDYQSERSLKKKLAQIEPDAEFDVHVLFVGKGPRDYDGDEDFVIARAIVYKDAEQLLQSPFHPGAKGYKRSDKTGGCVKEVYLATAERLRLLCLYLDHPFPCL